MPKHWFVTGSASGLGRSISEAVLASGDSLVATAREPKRLADLLEKYGDRVRTIALDVTDEKGCEIAVEKAVEAFGSLDVVVNNAGYGDIAPFEQMASERFKAVIDTNFYGVVNVTRAVIESKKAAVFCKFRRLAAVSPGPAVRLITPPNGLLADSPNRLPRR